MRQLAMNEARQVAGGEVYGSSPLNTSIVPNSSTSTSIDIGSCNISTSLQGNQSTTITATCGTLAYNWNSGVAASCLTIATGAAMMAAPLGPLLSAAVGLSTGAVCNALGGNGFSFESAPAPSSSGNNAQTSFCVDPAGVDPLGDADLMRDLYAV